jgi:ribosome biogenesis protein ERB1
LSQPPFILPLKILKTGKKSQDNAIVDIQFHPQQPWIFSAHASGVVYLWT